MYFSEKQILYLTGSSRYEIRSWRSAYAGKLFVCDRRNVQETRRYLLEMLRLSAKAKDVSGDGLVLLIQRV